MTVDQESTFARILLEDMMRVLNTDLAFQHWIKTLPIGEMTRLSVDLLRLFRLRVRDIETYTLTGKFNDER